MKKVNGFLEDEWMDGIGRASEEEEEEEEEDICVFFDGNITDKLVDDDVVDVDVDVVDDELAIRCNRL